MSRGLWHRRMKAPSSSIREAMRRLPNFWFLRAAALVLVSGRVPNVPPGKTVVSLRTFL